MSKKITEKKLERWRKALQRINDMADKYEAEIDECRPDRRVDMFDEAFDEADGLCLAFALVKRDSYNFGE